MIELFQCLKWRMPVTTITRLFCLQYSMESLSRIDPPGCMNAVIPAA